MNEAGRGVRHRRTVVVGEDERGIREAVSAVLVDAGWSVVSAASGEGVARALAAPAGGILPDALVLDVLLPGGGTAEFVERLLARWPGIPVVLLATRPNSPTASPVEGAPILRSTLDLDALAAMLAYLVTERWKAKFTANATTQAPIVTMPRRPEVRGELVGERRREDRFELDNPVPLRVFHSGEEVPREGAARDIASHGLGIWHSGSSFPLGTPLTLEFGKLRERGASTRVDGIVRWTRRVNNGNETGVEFSDPESRLVRSVVYALLVDD